MSKHTELADRLNKAIDLPETALCIEAYAIAKAIRALDSQGEDARDAARYRWWRSQLKVTRNDAVPDRIGIREVFLLVDEFECRPESDADYIDAATDILAKEPQP